MSEFVTWFERELQALVAVKNFDDMHMLQINYPLAKKAWDASAKIYEFDLEFQKGLNHGQESERDMIFGLLKQLRVSMFNMCNEEKSDLEWIYETNMLMKSIDFMFLHGYLQDSQTVLNIAEARIKELELANQNLKGINRDLCEELWKDDQD